ncbi:hypothetical protein J5N97_012859 [Dioscorea zingiberensis]|uniref:HSF-type DNA-binding domain-containing protein n=1 Tax=Dioscorea zingiberensis TaxID=325984 RepID=A0A9D5HI52_9LILI|nr:hypothetical protein J5N97_012859 [Dioscorea zingiberensis]
MENTDGSHGGLSSPAPFVIKTYDMVDDPSTDRVVSWSSNGCSFIVWNQPDFARDLLPKYFKHNNFSSFVRQLNTYGFHKVDPDQWEFANEEFIKGKSHLLKNIHRRKPIHSRSLQANSSGKLSEAEKQELEEEIESLKHEKGMLVPELQRHMQQQQGLEHQMENLEGRLQKLELRQRDIMDFFIQIAQRPEFPSNLVYPSDLYRKKRRLPNSNYFSEDTEMEENPITSFQAMRMEKSGAKLLHASDLEPYEKMESSLNSLENFLCRVSQASGGGIDYDGTTSYLPSSMVILEMHASSGDTDANLQSPTSNLNLSSPCLEDLHSSPQELAESTGYAESPGIAPLEIQTDARTKFPGIDVNSEPAAPEVQSSGDQTTMIPTSTVPTGVNDVFWQQFLTETPGSLDMQEVQSERRDIDENTGEGKIDKQGSVWWNKKSVDNLTEQMGSLNPVERS